MIYFSSDFSKHQQNKPFSPRFWDKHERLDPSNGWIHISGSVWYSGVEDISMHILDPLVPIKRHLNAMAFLNIVHHVHQYNVPCYKAKIISISFLEHDSDFPVLIVTRSQPNRTLLRTGGDLDHKCATDKSAEA